MRTRSLWPGCRDDGPGERRLHLGDRQTSAQASMPGRPSADRLTGCHRNDGSRAARPLPHRGPGGARSVGPGSLTGSPSPGTTAGAGRSRVDSLARHRCEQASERRWPYALLLRRCPRGDGQVPGGCCRIPRTQRRQRHTRRRQRSSSPEDLDVTAARLVDQHHAPLRGWLGHVDRVDGHELLVLAEHRENEVAPARLTPIIARNA
jgi:hypothetical protein